MAAVIKPSLAYGGICNSLLPSTNEQLQNNSLPTKPDSYIQKLNNYQICLETGDQNSGVIAPVITPPVITPSQTILNTYKSSSPGITDANKIYFFNMNSFTPYNTDSTKVYNNVLNNYEFDGGVNTATSDAAAAQSEFYSSYLNIKQQAQTAYDNQIISGNTSGAYNVYVSTFNTAYNNLKSNYGI